MNPAGNESLRGAVAIVTGASRGIGREIALLLAAGGASVVCAARSTAAAPSRLPGTLDETVREIEAAGGRAMAVACDVSREEQVTKMAERVIAEFGRIDLLVNNAAVNVMTPFAETPMKRWDLVLNVNLRGTVACTQAVLPSMLERGSGRIINVSSGAVSDAAITARLGIIPYAVSKAAVEMLTETLALELKPRGIAVNCLRIESAIATEGARLMNPDIDSSDWEEVATAAESIRWLATRELSYTGQIVTMSDVRHLRGQNE